MTHEAVKPDHIGVMPDHIGVMREVYPNSRQNNAIFSALDKLLGQLGIYATWLSSIAYLQKHLRIYHIFFSL